MITVLWNQFNICCEQSHLHVYWLCCECGFSFIFGDHKGGTTSQEFFLFWPVNTFWLDGWTATLKMDTRLTTNCRGSLNFYRIRLIIDMFKRTFFPLVELKRRNLQQWDRNSTSHSSFFKTTGALPSRDLRRISAWSNKHYRSTLWIDEFMAIEL